MIWLLLTKCLASGFDFVLSAGLLDVGEHLLVGSALNSGLQSFEVVCLVQHLVALWVKVSNFTDVLFKPKTSNLSSRSDVSLEKTFSFKYSKQKWTGVPIISSNMDTISNIDMFKVLSKYKCLTCFHKYINIHDIVQVCKEGYDPNFLF